VADRQQPDRQHVYQRVASQIAEQIDAGVFAPGERLPTQRQLAGDYEVSEIVIRQAIGLLRRDGRVVSRQGSGTFVREAPQIRRISWDRYRSDFDPSPSEQPATSFTRDAGIEWQQYRLDKAFRWIEADERLADLFGVEAGTRLLERNFVFYAADAPAQMSRSCLLASDVEGTPVADPRNEPWPGGNVGQLRTLGIEVDREIHESVSARLPTAEEARILNIGSGAPVLAITRRMTSQGRVVEVADPIVIPADRAVLDYLIRL
jgi:GntR family transcriptional regulator